MTAKAGCVVQLLGRLRHEDCLSSGVQGEHIGRHHLKNKVTDDLETELRLAEGLPTLDVAT